MRAKSQGWFWTQKLLGLLYRLAMQGGKRFAGLRWLLSVLFLAVFGVLPAPAVESARLGNSHVEMTSAANQNTPCKHKNGVAAKSAACSPSLSCNALLSPIGPDWYPTSFGAPAPLCSSVAGPDFELTPPVPPPRSVG